MSPKRRKERPRKPTGRRAPAPRPAEAEPVDAEIVEEGAEADGGAAESEPDQTELAQAAPPEAEPGEAGDDPEAADVPPSGLHASVRRAPAGEAGLVRYDPLRAYMAEVARHPLLSREAEHDLAVHYVRTGDVQAAYKLVASNLRLVVKIAHEYRRSAFHLLDLIQEGNMGLMQAVKKYDPFKGVKLSSYAAWWIRAYIIRFLMDNWRMVKLGTTQAQRKLFFNLSKEREKLLALGIEPTPRLLASNLRVEEKEVEEMSARMASEDMSLDAPLRGADDDSQQSRLDRLAAPAAPGADDRIGDEELKRVFREKLEAFARTLTDAREKTIFEKRLLPPEGAEPLTLQQVGEAYGLTRERARQIEAKLTDRLRAYLQAEIPDFELLTPPE